MSFLYPRAVMVTRPTQPTGVGAVAYGGEQQSTETPVVATPVPANIQLAKERGKPDANLPADAGKTLWKVFIPLQAVALGTILMRDVITDDLGQRYQVIGPYWNSLGHSCVCERLET
ncbi:hypothetical protein [Sideroxydans lithotrophicus]|uniref:Uncharacterized protein n=1 Tax=Sideroxydans lithotrophicus (strain ES-1) TaxID=580332 RepID=D5CT54_SIDLE|nr:hypothetical protein [Sideroxydans lithotrophicus]ADE12140.1 conserved hypothetical protein [Sideroxydans lithotrophicus ES-1]